MAIKKTYNDPVRRVHFPEAYYRIKGHKVTRPGPTAEGQLVTWTIEAYASGEHRRRDAPENKPFASFEMPDPPALEAIRDAGGWSALLDRMAAADAPEGPLYELTKASPLFQGGEDVLEE